MQYTTKQLADTIYPHPGVDVNYPSWRYSMSDFDTFKHHIVSANIKVELLDIPHILGFYLSVVILNDDTSNVVIDFHYEITPANTFVKHTLACQTQDDGMSIWSHRSLTNIVMWLFNDAIVHALEVDAEIKGIAAEMAQYAKERILSE